VFEHSRSFRNSAKAAGKKGFTILNLKIEIPILKSRSTVARPKALHPHSQCKISIIR
jgi:hypothetical protein